MAMSLQKGRLCSQRLIDWLTPFCVQIEVAGSIRRDRPEVGDVDLVVIPKLVVESDLFGVVTGSRNLASEAILVRAGRESWTILKDGAAHISWSSQSIQVDLWFTTILHWGSVLMCRTGSVQHNIWIAERAKAMGGHWAPHQGLRLPGRAHLVSETEDEIYCALGIAPIAPHARERGVLPAWPRPDLCDAAAVRNSSSG